MMLAQGTQATLEAIAAAVDKAEGYPRREAFVGNPGYPYVIPNTWDGMGATPPCWTKEKEAVYVVNPGTAFYRLEDSTADACAASPRLNASEKGAVAAARGGRINVADYAGRGSPTARAAAQAGQAR